MLQNVKLQSYQSVSLEPYDQSSNHQHVKAPISTPDDVDWNVHSSTDNILSHFNLCSAKGSRVSVVVKVLMAAAVLLTMVVMASHFSVPALSPSIDAVAFNFSASCNDRDYMKFTLKEEMTQSIGGMLKHSPNVPKFEASGMVYDASRDGYWVVFDNLWSIAMLTSDLSRNDENMLLESTRMDIDPDQDSGFEGIAWDKEEDLLYVVTESVEFQDNDGNTVYHPLIRSIKPDGDEFEGVKHYEEQVICACEFEAPSDNKGFEGLNMLTVGPKMAWGRQKYFVALCEGNYCKSGDEGEEPGNGRVVVIDAEFHEIWPGGEYQYLEDANMDIVCTAKTLKIVDLPKSVEFIDYSSIQIREKYYSFGSKREDWPTEEQKTWPDFDVVITSQQSAAMWVGTAKWTEADGLVFNDEGTIYQFPKAGDCETQFCNVEGVAMLPEGELTEFVMVSDKVKKNAKQPWICGEKDQSVHMFKIRD